MSGSTERSVAPEAADSAGPPTDRLADRLGSRPAAREGSPLVLALRELAAVDRAVYRAVASTPTPALDGPLRTLTGAADHSKLWLAASVAMFAIGGQKGRRAALTGVAAIGLTSAVVNLPMKIAGARRRPDADAAGVPEARRVEMPTSPSFPSGHSASAAAFAVAAATVGYTRVHSGVHYPGDVVAGVLVGASIGQVVAWAGRRIAGGR
jgi:undecaprenyl-diphosphatase